MEHRWGARFECRIPVLIEAASCGRVQAHTQNLSLSGAFLGISLTTELPTAVSVRFEPASGARHQHRRVLAYVIRRTTEGVALEWAEFAPRTIRSILNLSLVRYYCATLENGHAA